MDITVLDSGFVTGDFLKPVAYAGEMNSKILNIVHPTFDNAIYQLIVVKENRPYSLGIENGKILLPPSLTDIECILKCQFIAIRKSNDDLNNCDCQFTSSNDCTDMLFKSDSFSLKVAQGLNLNGLTPIPTYEELLDSYNNLTKAKLAVEKAKADNENVVNALDQKIQELQNNKYLTNLNVESLNRKEKDDELERRIDAIFDILQENDINSFISNILNNSAIKNNMNEIILTKDCCISTNFTLKSNLTLIIPENIVVSFNSNVVGNIEGNVIINGSVDISNLSELYVTGQITLNSIQSNIIMPAENINKIVAYHGACISKINNNEVTYILSSNELDNSSNISYVPVLIENKLKFNMIISGTFNLSFENNEKLINYNEISLTKNSTLTINSMEQINNLIFADGSKIIINDSVGILNYSVDVESDNYPVIIVSGLGVCSLDGQIFNEGIYTYKDNSFAQ